MKLETAVSEFLEATSTHSCENIGHMLTSYVLESNHNSWEGFDSRDKAAMARMLSDMARWMSSHKPEDIKQVAIYTGSHYVTADRNR